MAHVDASKRRLSPAAWAEYANPEPRADDPLRSLVEEHRLISRTLDVLESWAFDADQRERVPRPALQELVGVLTEFVDQVHNEKEETILMEALFDAGVDWTFGPLAALRLEHDQERYLSDVLRHLAYQTGEWSEHARLHFVSIARELVALQRRHLRTESTKLFPLVFSRLSPEARSDLARRMARFDRQVARQRDQLIAMMTVLTSPPSEHVRSVGDSAAAPVLAVSPNMSIDEASELAAEHGIHHLPVVLDGAVLGLVCTCDFDEFSPETHVSCVMHAPAITVDAGAPTAMAARLMTTHDVGSLLVMRDDALLGIVTRADLRRDGVEPSAWLGFQCVCCGSLDHLQRNETRGPLCADCRAQSLPSAPEDELGGGD